MKKIIIFFFGLMPILSSAQERAVTLQECISLALENNLDVKAGRISVDKARDLQGTAFDIDRTSLTLSQDPTSGGNPDNGISLSQSFEFPTVYAARRKYLKAETAVAQSTLELTRNEVVKNVSSCYYALLHARRTVEILKAQDSICTRFVAIATAKHRAGESGNLEQMNAERVSNENLFRLQKAEADYQSALLALRQITNVDEPIVPSESGLPAIQQPLPTDDFMFSQTALGGVFSARTTASERNLSLAKQGFLPGLTIGFTEQMLIKGFNPYNIDRTRFEKGNFMGFEVGVSIPLFWGGQNAKLKAARRDVELAEIARRQAEQKMNMAYNNALTEFQRAQKVLDYYTRKGNAQGEKMARLSQISYENGEIGYVEYIQNLQTALDVQLRFADAVNDYNQAIINLKFIKGEEK